jgi:hypothetical protein
MATRDQYVRQLKTQINRLNAQARKLEAKARKAATSPEAKRLRKASAAAFQDLVRGAGGALGRMRSAVGKAGRRFARTGKAKKKKK